MGGRLNVDFKNRLKSDLFLKSYIYSERGDFAASFYNKNSILMFFSKWAIFRGGGALTGRCSLFLTVSSNVAFVSKRIRLGSTIDDELSQCMHLVV